MKYLVLAKAIDFAEEVEKSEFPDGAYRIENDNAVSISSSMNIVITKSFEEDWLNWAESNIDRNKQDFYFYEG